jgi:hypothetical protein
MDRMGTGSFVKKLMCTGLALCLISMAAAWTPGYGQSQEKVKPELVLPKSYPDGFDGWGYLDRISDKEVVINDRLYTFAPSAEYHTPQDGIATIYSFKPGDMVGFMKNDVKQIVSLWLLK